MEPDTDGNGMKQSDDAYADIDNDGAFDSAEPTTEVDTDNDGTPDFLDDDSDNDDCSDTKEAGYADIEDDAKLGGSPIQVDSMGKVTTHQMATLRLKMETITRCMTIKK